MLATPTRALVRFSPSTYAPSYKARGVDISPPLVAEQHAAYVRALERAGLHVDTLPADEAFYDGVFVEDTAIVWGRSILITSMANPDRQGEQTAVRHYFSRTHDVIEMPAGAFLDGGDVMYAGDTTYVGLSSRTNAAGAAALRAFMARAGRVDAGLLHGLSIISV